MEGTSYPGEFRGPALEALETDKASLIEKCVTPFLKRSFIFLCGEHFCRVKKTFF